MVRVWLIERKPEMRPDGLRRMIVARRRKLSLLAACCAAVGATACHRDLGIRRQVSWEGATYEARVQWIECADTPSRRPRSLAGELLIHAQRPIAWADLRCVRLDLGGQLTGNAKLRGIAYFAGIPYSANARRDGTVRVSVRWVLGDLATTPIDAEKLTLQVDARSFLRCLRYVGEPR